MITTDLSPTSGPGLSGFSFPEDTALFAIGDVHGEAETLLALCAGIAATDTGSRRRHVVFLGDAVDKGPSSLDALDIVFNELGKLTGADEVTLLPGNHELLMADALDAARGRPAPKDAIITWLAASGIRVLSEAVTTPEHKALCDGILRDMAICETFEECRVAARPAAERFSELAPELFAAFAVRELDLPDAIRSMPSHLRIADVLCVHAGIDPLVPLETALGRPQHSHRDHEDHWAWSRERFLGSQVGWFPEGIRAHRKGAPASGGCLVLHGHTPPKRWQHYAGSNVQRIADIFDRTASNARICVDFGAGFGAGVGACLLTNEGHRLFFEPCIRS